MEPSGADQRNIFKMRKRSSVYHQHKSASMKPIGYDIRDISGNKFEEAFLKMQMSISNNIIGGPTKESTMVMKSQLQTSKASGSMGLQDDSLVECLSGVIENGSTSRRGQEKELLNMKYFRMRD